MNDCIYYVYKHTDPKTGELLYIGHGARGRAWIHGSDKTVLRGQEHLAHLEKMTDLGYLPSDWVEVVVRGLTKGTACEMEQEMIRTLKPKYNKPMGLHKLKITPDQFKQAKMLREYGMYYDDIAKRLGLSTMTIHRALNNKTKNIGDNYE